MPKAAPTSRPTAGGSVLVPPSTPARCAHASLTPERARRQPQLECSPAMGHESPAALSIAGQGLGRRLASRAILLRWASSPFSDTPSFHARAVPGQVATAKSSS